jgi:ABC-type tungstate transport system substrate-binding protein
MGLSLLAYLLLTVTGIWMFQARQSRSLRPSWLRSLHYAIGGCMVGLVLLLLAIGIVGTLGHFGSLGHSQHLVSGLVVVGLVLLSALSATQISAKRPWARSLHIGTNVILFVGFLWVSLTGWSVVQKYLP